MMDRQLRIAVLGLLGLVASGQWTSLAIFADEKAKVVARLGEQPITDRDVDFQLGRVAADSLEPLPELSPAILQSTIYLLAQQRQALQTLRSRSQAVGREDVERWLDENGQPVNGKTILPADMLRKQAEKTGVSEANLRDHLAFRLSWQRYLQQQLTEKNVAKHFENQPQRFDGTRFLVSIADVAAPAGKSTRRDDVAELLTGVGNRLLSAELSWEDAAAELQDSELLKGSAGQFQVRKKLWVRGTGDLEPTIITAVMKLQPHGVSEPIHTPTGVHLVQLDAIEAGERGLEEVRDEVRVHMLIHLLEHLARPSESQLPLRALEQEATRQ